MALDKTWRLHKNRNSHANRLYDWLRRGVNERLVCFLLRESIGPQHTSSNNTSVIRARVLEAGSGTAFASSLFGADGARTYAVCLDLDLAAVGEARMRDPTLPAVVGDISRMPFAEGVFDLVFNSSTIEHLSDPQSALAEMSRVCSRSGRVFVGVPYLWGPIGFQPLIARTKLGSWLGRVFTQRSLDRLLGSVGLTPEKHLRYFANFFIGAVAAKQSERDSFATKECEAC